MQWALRTNPYSARSPSCLTLSATATIGVKEFPPTHPHPVPRCLPENWNHSLRNCKVYNSFRRVESILVEDLINHIQSSVSTQGLVVQ